MAIRTCFQPRPPEQGLVAQVLPPARDVGKDLGIINLSNSVPQILAPLITVLVLGVLHADFRVLFLVASVSSAGGALMILPNRSVR